MKRHRALTGVRLSNIQLLFLPAYSFSTSYVSKCFLYVYRCFRLRESLEAIFPDVFLYLEAAEYEDAARIYWQRFHPSTRFWEL
jgi:hypothetical protein